MYNIIPQPVSILTSNDKKGFTLHAGTTITPSPFSDIFISFVRKTLNKKVREHEDTGEEKSIILKLDENISHDEGYTLRCENRRVFINAKTEAGLFYGLQTLMQMLLQTNGKLPYTLIEDYPRFSYRGFMLDSGRYFFPVGDVKRIADLMALHKLNVLHWHLTEDQGFRVEIKKYPLLTQKGSVRSHTNFNRKPHGGYYTAEDIKEIVGYCRKRNIKVIPEFDIPGHSSAAIACYPYLSCLDRKLEVATHWGVKHDILCAGKESTYRFVFDVLDELMQLFPGGVIHIGGDEAVKMRWRECPYCQKAIRENSLRDEDELQAYFMSRVNDYLKAHSFKSVMWNYDLNRADDIPADIAWTVCASPADGKAMKEEAMRGRKLINTAAFPYYLDLPYGWNTLKRVCSFNPALTDNEEDTLGVEGCMWTEYVPNMKVLERKAFPRLGAIAEAGWAQKDYPSFTTFLYKAEDYLKLLDVYSVNYTAIKRAHPSFAVKHMSSLWFRRRVFHWQGLYNLFDDAAAKREAEELREKLKNNCE